MSEVLSIAELSFSNNWSILIAFLLILFTGCLLGAGGSYALIFVRTLVSRRSPVRCSLPKVPAYDQIASTDLKEVLNTLAKHHFPASSYDTLGLELGLYTNTLEVIKHDHNDSQRRLLKCLEKWLTQVDKSFPPTWHSLIVALTMIEQNNVAISIDKEKHQACAIFHSAKTRLALIKITGNPHMKQMIEKEILEKDILILKSMNDGTDQALLEKVKRIICFNHQAIEIFATILTKYPSTKSVGVEILEEYGRHYPKTPWKQQEVISSNPVLHIREADCSEFTTMKTKFTDLFYDAIETMKDKPPLDKLKTYLKIHFSETTPHVSCQNTKEAIMIIKSSCSLINIGLLEAIVDKFQVDAMYTAIKQYNKSLEEFCKNMSLRKCLDQKFSNGSPLLCETITFLVTKNVDESTLKDVKSLISKIFSHVAPFVNLVVIEETESFRITCSFRLVHSQLLITTALENITSENIKGILQIHIGYCTVYDAKELNKGKEQSIYACKGALEQLVLSLSVQYLACEHHLSHFASINEDLTNKSMKIEEAKNLKESGSINQDTENKDEEKTEKLQPTKTLQQTMSFEIDNLRKDLQQEQDKNAALQQQMTSQLIEKDKEMTKMRETIQILLKEIEDLKKVPRQENPLKFNDDIYGGITIDHPLIIKIVQTRQFQRLKNIKQIGYTYQNIPKAKYSRLQHSIGMYYLAGEYIKQLQQRQPELNITESDVLCVQTAALCYNLGHGPFSHIFQIFMDEVFPNGDKPWESLSEASGMMLDFMIEENDEVKNLLEKYLDDYEKDIAFIKELIHGARKEQRKGKEFLYEIVVNKTSGLDVCMIDSTTRDAAALGMKISFKWRVFLSKVQVRSENGEPHIFFQKDDLKIYNDLFEKRYTLYRDLYYLRKNRIVALIIKRILVKSNKKPIIRDGNRLVTISEATNSMSAFTQLNDSVLRSHDDDPEVQALLNCLDSKESFGRIGHVIQTSDWHKEQIKQHIIQSTKSYDISDHLIIDPIIHGYENHESLTQYYYTSDGKTGQWTHEWAQLPPTAHIRVVAPLRIFLVSGNMDLIHEVQEVLRNLQANEGLDGDRYSDQENFNLMEISEMTEPKPLAAKDNDK